MTIKSRAIFILLWMISQQALSFYQHCLHSDYGSRFSQSDSYLLACFNKNHDTDHFENNQNIDNYQHNSHHNHHIEMEANNCTTGNNSISDCEKHPACCQPPLIEQNIFTTEIPTQHALRTHVSEIGSTTNFIDTIYRPPIFSW